MKPYVLTDDRRLFLGCQLLASLLILIFSRPLALIFLSYVITMIALEYHATVAKKPVVSSEPRRQRHRPRDTGAGRWLEAPVAELDKSTVGKLLASRASRDPGLHVVVGSTHPPACSDVLYDPELDG